MLDTEIFPYRLWELNVTGPLSSKTISVNMRHNDKILIDAQDRQMQYSMKRNRLGWTFEGLLRSIALAAGTILGGPVGAATLGAVGGGIGRGIGEHMGNRIYGQTMNDLDEIMDQYKYRQLLNQYMNESNNGTRTMLNELYTQNYDANEEIIRDLGQ